MCFAEKPRAEYQIYIPLSRAARVTITPIGLRRSESLEWHQLGRWRTSSSGPHDVERNLRRLARMFDHPDPATGGHGALHLPRRAVRLSSRPSRWSERNAISGRVGPSDAPLLPPRLTIAEGLGHDRNRFAPFAYTAKTLRRVQGSVSQRPPGPSAADVIVGTLSACPVLAHCPWTLSKPVTGR